MYDQEEMLLLSGIQHFAFCRRQWALIHIEQQWQENVRTLEGMFLHDKAHKASSEKRGDTIITRSMPVLSRELGIQGVCDVVEFIQCDEGVELFGRKDRYLPVPVEYKRGKPKENDADILQLCAQAMCLEEMLVCEIPEGHLYYGETKRRTIVPFEEQLKEKVRSMVLEMHEYYKKGYTPKVKPMKVCKACSLEDICVPKLGKSKSAAAYIRAKLSEGEEQE